MPTEELVADDFGLARRVLPDPETGTPTVVPRRPPRARTSTADGASRADG